MWLCRANVTIIRCRALDARNGEDDVVSIFGIRFAEPAWYAGFDCPRCASDVQIIGVQPFQ